MNMQSLKGSGDVPVPSIEPSPQWEETKRLIQSVDIPQGLVQLPPSAPIEKFLAALDRDGAVIIEKAVSSESCDLLKEQMNAYVGSASFGDGFLGKQTRRAGCVVSRAPASWEFLTHPTLTELCDGVLGRQILHLPSREQLATKLTPGNKKFGWQLSLSQIIAIGDGNRAQPLHCDGWGFVFDFEKEIEPEISTIWALQDFNVENGATRVALGSHRWPRGRQPRENVEREQTRAKNPSDAVAGGEWEDEHDVVVQAVMPKGSVIVYLGSTWHSGGANTCGSERWGFNVDYNLSCLRQEENQYLACPPSIAKRLPEPIQRLVGYTMSGYSFGYFGEYQHPRESFGEKPVNWATDHLLSPVPPRSKY
jgi:hypothetical protein